MAGRDSARLLSVAVLGRYFGSTGVEGGGGGGGGALCCTTGGGAGVGSVKPLMPSLKPFSPSPSPLPNSGSRLAPNSRNATTPSTTRCHGCNRSPIDSILRAPPSAAAHSIGV